MVKEIKNNNMVNAQEYLNKYFPTNERVNISKLNIYNQNLTGHLDLSTFPNLKELNCFFNHLTSLDISNCPLLEEVRVSANKIHQNLSVFSHLKNLKILDLGNSDSISYYYDNNSLKNKFKKKILIKLTAKSFLNNNFYGSLKSLENCKNLEHLCLVFQDEITEGLEYLPTEKIIDFGCNGTVFQDILRPYDYDVQIYKIYNFSKIIKVDEANQLVRGKMFSELEKRNLLKNEPLKIQRILRLENKVNLLFYKIQGEENKEKKLLEPSELTKFESDIIFFKEKFQKEVFERGEVEITDFRGFVFAGRKTIEDIGELTINEIDGSDDVVDLGLGVPKREFNSLFERLIKIHVNKEEEEDKGKAKDKFEEIFEEIDGSVVSIENVIKTNSDSLVPLYKEKNKEWKVNELWTVFAVNEKLTYACSFSDCGESFTISPNYLLPNPRVWQFKGNFVCFECARKCGHVFPRLHSLVKYSHEDEIYLRLSNISESSINNEVVQRVEKKYNEELKNAKHVLVRVKEVMDKIQEKNTKLQDKVNLLQSRAKQFKTQTDIQLEKLREGKGELQDERQKINQGDREDSEKQKLLRINKLKLLENDFETLVYENQSLRIDKIELEVAEKELESLKKDLEEMEWSRDEWEQKHNQLDLEIGRLTPQINKLNGDLFQRYEEIKELKEKNESLEKNLNEQIRLKRMSNLMNFTSAVVDHVPFITDKTRDLIKNSITAGNVYVALKGSPRFTYEGLIGFFAILSYCFFKWLIRKFFGGKKTEQQQPINITIKQEAEKVQRDTKDSVYTVLEAKNEVDVLEAQPIKVIKQNEETQKSEVVDDNSEEK